ncbi:MAG: hypothetical protein F4227_08090 [Gammaproteobacteria bacterium]|nr:hypothetical protein [Gammaproteobacteria bacterium]
MDLLTLRSHHEPLFKTGARRDLWPEEFSERGNFGIPDTRSRDGWWPRKHDTLWFYTHSLEQWTFTPQQERQYYSKPFRHTTQDEKGRYYVDSWLRDVWDHDDTKPPISQSPERTGYPTQNPLALLERIIKASSNEVQVVFAPFCGCATTLVAADRLNRDWVGIDISDVAVRLVEERIKADQGLFQDIKSRQDVPQRTDIGEILKYHDLQNKKLLYGEQGGHCNGCGKHFEQQNLEVDHIIAQKQGFVE